MALVGIILSSHVLPFRLSHGWVRTSLESITLATTCRFVVGEEVIVTAQSRTEGRGHPTVNDERVYKGEGNWLLVLLGFLITFSVGAVGGRSTADPRNLDGRSAALVNGRGAPLFLVG